MRMAQNGSEAATRAGKRANAAGPRPSARVVPAIPHALKSARREKPDPSQPAAQERTDELPLAAVATATPPGSTMRENEDGIGALGQAVAEGEIPMLADVNGASTLDTAATAEIESTTPSAVAVPAAADYVSKEKQANEGSLDASTDKDADVTTQPEPSARPPPQTKADLPPPFYPAQQPQPNPPSTSAAPFQADFHPRNIPAHEPRLSANSLVFGSLRDSSDSSPAPVPSQGVQNPPFQGHSGGPSGPVTYYPHGQQVHLHEQHSGPVYPAPFVHTPYSYPYGREYYNHMSPPQSRPFYPSGGRFQQHGRRPPEYNFSPRYNAPHPFNPYAQHPQAPPRPLEQFNNDQPRFIPPVSLPERESVPRRVSDQLSAAQSNATPFVQADPKANTTEEPPTVAQYLCSQFGNAEFADYVLQLSHTGYLFPPTTLPAHGVILARSPKLRSLMAMQHGNQSSSPSGAKVLNIPVSDRFLNMEAPLMKSLMRLYGESLPDKQIVARLAAPTTYPEAGSPEAVQMRFALAYAAAGHFLQIDEIISHGLNLASSFLSWDTVGKALAFALDGGLSSTFTQYETPARDKGSNSSLDETPAKLDSPSSAPTYGFYSDRMLSYCVNFLVHNCPPDFKLSGNSPQLNDPPRLPIDAEPRHSRSNSRLSHIRFGEMTLDDANFADPVTEQMSSILLSLPFAVLKHLFSSNILGERLGWARLSEIVKAVVNEREQRRHRAMKNRNMNAPSSAVEERLWRTVRWVEVVDATDQHPLGLKLSRHLVDAETPRSAGSEKA